MLEFKPIDKFFREHNLSLINSDALSKIQYLKSHLGLEFDIDSGPWIAGGSVIKLARGEDLNESDVDIFFPSRESIEYFDQVLSAQMNEDQKELKRTGKKKVYPFESGTANTYPLIAGKFQTIKRKCYKSVYGVLGDFDFVVCQFATDGKTLAYTPQALSDMKTKSLRLNRIHKESSLINRFYKYLANGYTPVPGLTMQIHGQVCGEIGRYSRGDGYTISTRAVY